MILLKGDSLHPSVKYSYWWAGMRNEVRAGVCPHEIWFRDDGTWAGVRLFYIRLLKESRILEMSIADPLVQR